jgi:hypothetical protein
MRAPRRTTPFVLLMLLAMAGPALAQSSGDSCSKPPESGGFTFWLNHRIACIIARETPQETHAEAPTASHGSTSLIEKAKAPDVFSLALGLMGAGTKPGEEDRATSMTVSAFAVRASVTGDNPLNPAVYDRYRQWRHWSFTVGRAEGKDDTPDGRLLGVKWLAVDRRDVAANQASLQAVSNSLTKLGGASTAALGKANAFIARALNPDAFAAAKSQADTDELEVNFAASQLSLANYAATVAKLDDEQLAALDDLLTDDAMKVSGARAEISNVIREMRHAPQLAFTYQALVRPDDADDEHHFGVVFDVGFGSRFSTTFNGTLVKTDHQLVPDTRVTKVAGELQFDLQEVTSLGDLLRRKRRDPMTVSVAGLGEWHSDDSPSIAKLQVKFTLPMPGIISGLKIPFSVTVANRTELIDEKEIRGQVGFTVDLSKIQKSLGALKGR